MSPLALSLRLLQSQPDGRLLALARGGHELAFEALVRRYRRPLLVYCRRITPDAAEDVLQQGLFQAWGALNAGAEVTEARAWLYRIVHNAAISAVRSRAQAPVMLVDAVAPSGIEHLVEQRMAAREVLAHLAALPELQREVMLGSALEGRSHEELAAELGLSCGSIRGLIYRARAALRSAAAGMIPSPLIDWAMRGAARTGPAYRAFAGGGSIGTASVLIKGGTAATLAGALAGAAAIVTIHPAAHPRHSERAAKIATARSPRGRGSDPSAPIIVGSSIAPAEAVGVPVAESLPDLGTSSSGDGHQGAATGVLRGRESPGHPHASPVATDWRHSGPGEGSGGHSRLRGYGHVESSGGSSQGNGQAEPSDGGSPDGSNATMASATPAAAPSSLTADAAAPSATGSATDGADSVQPAQGSSQQAVGSAPASGGTGQPPAADGPGSVGSQPPASPPANGD